MKMVFEKIAIRNYLLEKIKTLEMGLLKMINYRIPASNFS